MGKKSKVTLAVEKNDKIVSEITKLRDNYTCQVCGKTRDEVTLHYHHTVKTKGSSFQLRFDSKNCVTLCAGCHFKVHNDSNLTWVDYWRGRVRQLIPLAVEDELLEKHNTGKLKRNLGCMAELKEELLKELEKLKEIDLNYSYQNISSGNNRYM